LGPLIFIYFWGPLYDNRAPVFYNANLKEQDAGFLSVPCMGHALMDKPDFPFFHGAGDQTGGKLFRNFAKLRG
jgi:hypothetical protein